jgi:SpoVK/Ycf46/Vps4 family AAA+-type ATPase
MNDDDKNNSNKRPRNNLINTDVNKKSRPIILYDEFEDIIITEKAIPREFIKIETQISTIKDLIELGNTYDPNKDYNINMKMLNKLVEPLKELDKMIGMLKVKHDIVDHILFYMQNLDDKNIDMLHTVIEGPPGVGKTELGKILAKIYLAMGILKNDIFKKVSRSDMVAKYLGQTAIKTQDLIDSCFGGVMFIDEVYSLGNKTLHDSFSKEAIDTLNEKLSEMKNNFVCIVAGYSKEINECFFSYNQGLQSRFPIRFIIEPYKPKELLKIFIKICNQYGWEVDDSVKTSFFKKNFNDLKFFGRDIENLITMCKRAHCKRLMLEPDSKRKLITLADLKKGFNNFLTNKT